MNCLSPTGRSQRNNTGRRLPAVIGVTAMLLLSGCAAMQGTPPESETLELVPITSEPTGQHHPGRFVWHDLLTNDLAAAKQFYGGLFGWTFETRGIYTIISNQGIPMAGMAEVVFNPGVSPYWLPYLSVGDVDESLAAAKEAGAQLLKGPGEMTNRGRYALIGDPHGARVTLLRSSNGDPTPGPVTVNGWLWDELWTSDLNRSLAFYRQLAPYKSQVPVGAGEQQYRILTIDGKPIGGMTTLPDANINSQWVPVVRVTDLKQLLERVEKLGGRTLIKPDHSLSEGAVALVQDPTGAIFMVEPWDPQNRPTDDDGKETRP